MMLFTRIVSTNQSFLVERGFAWPAVRLFLSATKLKVKASLPFKDVFKSVAESLKRQRSPNNFGFFWLVVGERRRR